MENWGLVTYQYYLIYLDDVDYLESYVASGAEVIAHELMHHWTGNLVTCTWWPTDWCAWMFIFRQGHNDRERTDENYCKCVDQISFFFVTILSQSSNFCSNRACNFCVFEAVRRKKKGHHDHTVWFYSTAQRENDEKRNEMFLHKLFVCAFSIFGCYIFSSKYINVLRGKMGFHLDFCVCWILS